MAANLFSGTGDPNGVVFGDPGDAYQDETGAFWTKASGVATNTDWAQANSGTTSGGEAGLLGTGTGLDPLIAVAGPFRPFDQVFAMDDYLTPYAPLTAGVPSVQGVGYTSILKSAGGSTQFSVNSAAGPLGPGVGSMMGVMDLQLIGAAAGEFISATQFRDGADSGQCINMSLLVGNWDLWWSGRVSFEGLNDFETNQRAFAGFREQIDLSVIGTREGAWFHPRDNGVQVNWFAFYRTYPRDVERMQRELVAETAAAV